MPKTSATLTNCYVPLLISSDGSQKLSENLDPNKRKSGDGSTRGSKSLRRLCLDRSVLTASSGSSLVECGLTKVLCSVHGPRPAAASSLSGGKTEFHSSGVLNCVIRFAPNFGVRPESKAMSTATNLDGYGSGGGSSTEEIELSSRLHRTISSSIPLELLRKSVVDVFVMVLQGGGSDFPACVTAASLALADAGVEIYDLVSSCSVAVVRKENYGIQINNCDSFYLLADPTDEETQKADGIVTLSILPNWKEVTLWDQTGRLPAHLSSEALELCRDGCTTIYEFMRQCLVRPPNSL